jgi:hypothetical protein
MAEVAELTDQQPRVVDLGARFSPAARQRIADYIDSFVSFEPVLGLLYSDVSGQGSWSLAALGQETVDEMVKLYSGFGAVVCYEIDGVRVVVPQLAHIEQLDTGLLEFVGDRLCRRPPDES